MAVCVCVCVGKDPVDEFHMKATVKPFPLLAEELSSSTQVEGWPFMGQEWGPRPGEWAASYSLLYRLGQSQL